MKIIDPAVVSPLRTPFLSLILSHASFPSHIFLLWTLFSPQICQTGLKVSPPQDVCLKLVKLLKKAARRSQKPK
jgi:hypothetical protein